MNIFNLLGAEEIFKPVNGDYAFLNSIITFLNKSIIPITISLLVLGAVFSLCLVFMIIKAESADRSEELKKRLKGFVLTIIIVLISVWLLSWLLVYLPDIINAIRNGPDDFIGPPAPEETPGTENFISGILSFLRSL